MIKVFNLFVVNFFFNCFISYEVIDDDVVFLINMVSFIYILVVSVVYVEKLCQFIGLYLVKIIKMIWIKQDKEDNVKVFKILRVFIQDFMQD